MSYSQTEMAFPNRLKKEKCECCGHVSIEYHRSYNSNMALALIILFNENTQKYVHLENLILSKGYKRCGDFSYLVHYRHIEKMEGKRQDGSVKNGMYRITSGGILFVEGISKVYKTFIMKDGKLRGFEGEMITIQEALANKFDFNTLMGKNQ